MGLDKFNVAPDNKGGRKKGSRNSASNTSEADDSFGTRPINLEYETKPLTQGRDNEAYWQHVFDKFCPLGDPTDKQIQKIVRYTQTRPDTVKIKLHFWDVCEIDGVDELLFSPHKKSSNSSGSTSSQSSSDDSSTETSSGLSSLIDNAS